MTRGGSRPGSGRPPEAERRGSVVGVRASEGERLRWQLAAEASGLSLSGWARETLDVEAERVLLAESPPPSGPGVAR